MNVHAPIPADLRAQFPGVGDWHYLDSAATAQKPRAVIEAIARGYGEDYATVHRGVYDRSANMTRAYEAARATVARFLGGAAGEVVFTRGATEAINLVAASWGRDHVGAGDAILLSRLEHHSNIVPWQMLAQAVGAEIRVAEVREDGQIDLDSLRDRLDGRVRIVALSHLSNVTGALLDAPAVAAMAREVGAAFLLDGCQAAPRLPLDVAALGCDFYVASAHKMYGPTGIGALWAKAGLLDAMPPYQGGGSMIDRVSFEEGTTYAPAPTRFEAGTPHIVGAVGFGAACDWIEGVGREAIAAHENALVAATREGLRARNDIALYGPADAHGIVSFNMDGVHAHDVATILDDVGVAVRAGHHCCQPLMDRLGVPATVRASFAAHSDMGDVEALLDGLEKVKRIFG